MVISQPAVYCLAVSKERFVDSSLVRWLRSLANPEPIVGETRATPRPSPRPIAAESVGPGDQAPESAPLTAVERRARAAALRGLLLARQRRFDAAERAFAEALRLDPDLDLATVPTFWELERSAHEAVVRVYDAGGQGRRAALLAARLQQRFRPRLVPARPAPASRPDPSPVGSL